MLKVQMKGTDTDLRHFSAGFSTMAYFIFLAQIFLLLLQVDMCVSVYVSFTNLNGSHLYQIQRLVVFFYAAEFSL